MQVKLPEVTLTYEDQGSGVPLLLIHGYPLSRKMWEPQLAGLSKAARIIAPDLRGHGESQAIPGPYSMEGLADDCAQLLEMIGIDRPVVLCGLSMGGYIALAYLRKYAHRVGGLILAATRAGPDTQELRAARDRAVAQAQAEGVPAVVASILPKILAPVTYERRPELVEKVKGIMESISLEGMKGDLMGMKARPDSTPVLATIQKPVLILHGADDELILPKEGESMHREIPGSVLEILPEAGHLPNLEQTELFNAAVLRFLQRTAGGS